MCEFRVGLCSDLSFVVQVSIFLTQSLACKLLHNPQQLVRLLRVGKSMVRAARRTGRRRVKWPPRRPRYPRMGVRRCVYRWRMILSWWICLLAKLSCGSLRLVGRTPKQQCEDLHPDLWGGGQSEADLNKRLMVDRMAKPTFSGDHLTWIKEFIEAAERDSKSTGKDKKNKRSKKK